jgi:hypothetical protein
MVVMVMLITMEQQQLNDDGGSSGTSLRHEICVSLFFRASESHLSSISSVTF